MAPKPVGGGAAGGMAGNLSTSVTAINRRNVTSPGGLFLRREGLADRPLAGSGMLGCGVRVLRGLCHVRATDPP